MYFYYSNRYVECKAQIKTDGLNEKRPGEEDEAMGMTMTQKILAAHAGLAEVKAGQLIERSWIWCLEMTSPLRLPSMR